MKTNTLTIKPLIDDGFHVEYMAGSLETTHGAYFTSVSEGENGDFLVTISKENVVFAKVFPTMRHVMDALLTFVENDERFLKVTD